MSDPRTTGAFGEAMSTVFGVATARYAGSNTGAELLVRRHLEEATADGTTAVEAWSTLFSAAMIALCDVNAELAHARSTSPAKLMTTAALEHAAAKATS